MQYYKCKCGKSEAWSSMGSPTCRVCDECGSTLATSPSGHREQTPHKWTTLYDDHTGKPYRLCFHCGEKDKNTDDPTYAELRAAIDRVARLKAVLQYKPGDDDANGYDAGYVIGWNDAVTEALTALESQP